MNLLFAENAWLGPGQFESNLLIEFDTVIRSIRHVSPASISTDAPRVQFLTPGLINAHCHLEYANLAGQLPRGPIPFGQWMQAIINARTNDPAAADQRTSAMQSAARDLVAGGCSTVLDSTTDGQSTAHLHRAGVRHFLFHEVLGLSPDRAEPILDRALTRINSTQPGPSHLGDGLNPHAPYSVGPWLRERLRAVDLRHNPQAWHLAETTDESDLFQTGTGSIADFLDSHQMPRPTDKTGQTPYEFLDSENLLDQCSIAFHGNTLSPKEAAHFTGSRAIVHCPSTHRWFQRPPVPLAQWLSAGANVCLGTDSPASSDTLSMLEILQLTSEDHPDLTTDTLLQIACTNPCRLPFLTKSGLTGTISPGAPADLVALKHPGTNQDNLFSSSATTISQVWVAGHPMIGAD